jgi:putative ABC transport system permease protein
LIEHRNVLPNAPSPNGFVSISSEDYFKTVGEPLLRGRAFNGMDTRESLPVAIINQSLASRYWPNEDPVGQSVTFDNGATWSTIIGVVSNARQQIDVEPQDEIHFPLRAGNALNAGSLIVRAHGPPGTLAAGLREAIHRVDPQQPITRIETLDQVRTRALASPTLLATLLGLFALLALLITATGIGGVLAFSVNQRTQEIGIRMALGANHGNVLRMVLRQGLSLVMIGLAAGGLGAVLLVRLMKEMLYRTSPTDPFSFIVVAAVLLGVATLACLMPARRATMVNPISALRAN